MFIPRASMRVKMQAEYATDGVAQLTAVSSVLEG